MDAALITVSFRGDLELARDLCASVDRFVPREIEHVLVVPKSDAALFSSLADTRRRLVTIEQLLPRSFMRVMQSCRIDLKPLISRRVREIWITPRGLVRGWIVQQIVKLSCDKATDRDILVFADSDLVFVRPFTEECLIRDSRVRLYRSPGHTQDSPSHRSWHRAAAKLLGLPPQDYFGADYIGNPISWRRGVLQKLQARIAQTGRQPWQSVLAAMPGFSEYILYGVFADHVLSEASGHFADTEDLTHASWHYQGTSAASLDRFVAEFGENHVAVLIQSTTDLPMAERRALIEKMTRKLRQVA